MSKRVAFTFAVAAVGAVLVVAYAVGRESREAGTPTEIRSAADALREATLRNQTAEHKELTAQFAEELGLAKRITKLAWQLGPSADLVVLPIISDDRECELLRAYLIVVLALAYRSPSSGLTAEVLAEQSRSQLLRAAAGFYKRCEPNESHGSDPARGEKRIDRVWDFLPGSGLFNSESRYGFWHYTALMIRSNFFDSGTFERLISNSR